MQTAQAANRLDEADGFYQNFFQQQIRDFLIGSGKIVAIPRISVTLRGSSASGLFLGICNRRGFMFRFALVSLGLFCLMPAVALATPVAITNPSFESPDLGGTGSTPSATGWTFSGTGGGVFDYTGTGEFNVVPPDGDQVAYLSPSFNPGAAAMEQTVGTVLANSIYTLTGWAGRPNTINSGAIYAAQLVANGTTVLATSGGNAPLGSFEQFTTIFNSTGSAFIGANLSIRITNSEAQTEFDAIALDVSPVPEPSTFVMLALGGMFFAARRRKRCRS